MLEPVTSLMELIYEFLIYSLIGVLIFCFVSFVCFVSYLFKRGFLRWREQRRARQARWEEARRRTIRLRNRDADPEQETKF